MSESESLPTESAKSEAIASAPAPRSHVDNTANASHWGVWVALAVAVVAAVLAGLAYFHPPQHTATGVPQQSGDAKANVCAAYGSAHKAVVINTHLQSPNPELQLSIAANARLALVGGGAYLQQRLAANSGAPSDLANAARTFADTLQQLGINYMNESAPDVQDGIRKNLDSQITQLDKMCT